MRDDTARRLFPGIRPLDYATALKLALANLETGQHLSLRDVRRHDGRQRPQLGADRLAQIELKAPITDACGLCLRAHQVHLDPTLGRIPNRAMGEGVQIEIAAEFTDPTCTISRVFVYHPITPIRDIDWANRTSGQPHDVDWVKGACLAMSDACFAATFAHSCR